MPVFRNIGGSWLPCTVWRNIGGAWLAGTLWRNISGTWLVVSTLFAPDGGTVSNSGSIPGSTSVTLSCSVPATWTFGTLPANCSSSGPSGTVSNSIVFTFTLSAGSGSRSIPVTGVASGITRNFTVNLSLS